MTVYPGFTLYSLINNYNRKYSQYHIIGSCIIVAWLLPDYTYLQYNRCRWRSRTCLPFQSILCNYQLFWGCPLNTKQNSWKDLFSSVGQGYLVQSFTSILIKSYFHQRLSVLIITNDFYLSLMSYDPTK